MREVEENSGLASPGQFVDARNANVSYLVPCGKDKYISKSELLLHLKTYNIYYEGQNLQLRHREEEGELIVEGLLNISWGLRRPIRLSVLKPSTLPDIQVTDAEATPNAEAPGSGAGSAKSQPEETPQLMRTRSDVGVRRRGSARTPSEQRRIRRHQKQKLRASDYPLIARILQGPCEQVSKVFLMEKDQVEEVTYDVAQYIKFEMPVLRSFIQKLEEEEDREVKKLMRKYSILRLMIEQRLEEISEGPTAM
ncbi:PREDICTED: ras association domain-containing protein 2 [Pygoscelis adeliae]|uniref:ras association domain-containing protein 2 n=1 Tax=Pygoscelis adeliae TaxID=9238 RepID=UPI0004F50A56|nr:PREDICTED: ras association domain-containing protein 2 [Pygoscelis adeliae]